MAKNNFTFIGEVKNAIIGSVININQEKIDISSESVDEINTLLRDLIDKAHRITERNSSQVKLEDLHNDDFSHWLRDKGYYITDQTRSGRSNVSVGEVDLMVRKRNGTPHSIIEAFRLSTCTPSNSVIDSHINKLLSNYDTAGLKENYILVYAESRNFLELWLNYVDYISHLNTKPNFTTNHKLISFADVSNEHVNVTDIRVGHGKHFRENVEINIMHVFINMHK